VAKASVYDDAVVAPLLACKVPQGSKVDVLGSGYRTAFVRVVEGTANGCQGTVPKGNVSDQQPGDQRRAAGKNGRIVDLGQAEML